MTIYDLKLYGAFFTHLLGGGEVRLTNERAELPERTPYVYKFEATVLKQYGSKQDVLELQFDDGHTEHVTLYEPSMYLDDGEWKTAKDRKVAEKFLEKYEELKEMDEIGKNQSIFDLTFYGWLADNGLRAPSVEISLCRGNPERVLIDDGIPFTATVLKEYKGNKYVVKAVNALDETYYIPLFNANMYYDKGKRRWAYGNESSIPSKILKCYVKYLNG